jgi:uncharacterized membrane protein YjgN (DUF898 family)
LLLLLMPLAYPTFLSILARWRTDGTRFGTVRLVSHLKKRAFLGCFAAWILSTVGFVAVYSLMVLPSKDALTTALTTGTGPATYATFGLITAGYLVFLLGLGVLHRHFIIRGTWRVIVGSLTVSNLEGIDAVVAAGQPSSGLGEGLADALDFGGGL